ncbi:hypothetical protein AXG93_4666s1400 [Marchantia polymorpha subsp. ruderalis]|uniref:Uncharacterized protein n=1 Tax=Marchantia polymorpha subsp. ruderalis TaxID=1480154 RepID=A0A176W288_MARPO|nr:hypothetical protein AXG93_4666s1400 [Marchantia polymorpha subsp. ruderalis]
MYIPPEAFEPKADRKELLPQKVGFVELALTGTPIYWARILWKATRQHVQEEKGGSINHFSPFLINFYRSMGCLTASDRVQFPLLSRINPGRYVKDVEVDTNTDETLACTPPTRLRAEEEPWAVRVPRKQKCDGEADQSQRRAPAASVRSRATHEPSSRPKQKACKLVLPASSADTGRAVERRNSPSSGEDASARVSGRTADLPAPKARMPSGEALRPSGQGRHQAAPTSMVATDRCLASEQVPFDDSTSGQEPSAREKWREEPSAQGPSAQRTSANRTSEAGLPKAIADQTSEAALPKARSPTPLEMLAGSGAAVAAEEAARPSSRESPRNSVVIEILEDDSGSEEEEVESVQGTPTGVLCEQVVPLL